MEQYKYKNPRAPQEGVSEGYKPETKLILEWSSRYEPKHAQITFL